jgi:hypothetical protein
MGKKKNFFKFYYRLSYVPAYELCCEGVTKFYPQHSSGDKTSYNYASWQVLDFEYTNKN